MCCGIKVYLKGKGKSKGKRGKMLIFAHIAIIIGLYIL